MTNKAAPTQRQRKRRYPAYTDYIAVRVIGRNKATGKLWIKTRGFETRLIDAGLVQP